MLFEIQHRFTRAILFSLECGSAKVCVEAAINARANLAGANLAWANLARANLARANLAGANLAGANLAGANLAGANLTWADLTGADLTGADLAGANLAWAKLAGANLAGADLAGAELTAARLAGARLAGAKLAGADLTWANLAGANLAGANLAGANLTGAKLAGANLTWAKLAGANLAGADLAGADLAGATKLTDAINVGLVLAKHRITPTDGAFVGWKSVLAKGQKCIAQIVIPHDAQRMNALGSRKCRASKASVHAMWLDGKPFEGPAYDEHTGKTEYRVGQEVLPDKFDPDIWVECSHGIHFFLSREEAEAW